MNPENLNNIAQLVENLEKLTNNLEGAYNKNNAEDFKSIKKEILDTQDKLSMILR
jgi:hypothetical protein